MNSPYTAPLFMACHTSTTSMCPVASSWQILEKPGSLSLHLSLFHRSVACNSQNPSDRRARGSILPQPPCPSYASELPPHCTLSHLPAGSFYPMSNLHQTFKVIFQSQGNCWRVKNHCTWIHSCSTKTAQRIRKASSLHWGKYSFQALHVSPPCTEPSPPLHGQEADKFLN